MFRLTNTQEMYKDTYILSESRLCKLCVRVWGGSVDIAQIATQDAHPYNTTKGVDTIECVVGVAVVKKEGYPRSCARMGERKNVDGDNEYGIQVRGGAACNRVDGGKLATSSLLLLR